MNELPVVMILMIRTILAAVLAAISILILLNMIDPIITPTKIIDIE